MSDHEEQQRNERTAQPPNPRITRPRMLIEQTLSELSRFATAQEITDILRNRGTRIGTTTAYRNLQMMASQGKLDVIHINGETPCITPAPTIVTTTTSCAGVAGRP
ncbi:transcriptional repressor [Bifidobacterium callitrichos]|uniref:Ferric uptake regulator, Fur family n=1 Tax=Bifidobacterium callitrichos DSM 23973 TaxID=1437609 RepID=A0A087ACC1_9BIFI|nr:transcriptional repressor [Bifidobacterium callitrichos]KFI56421.1 ferric uptake regulator, Fur family [Bifidobacterium callitrichos DSM 23973]